MTGVARISYPAVRLLRIVRIAAVTTGHLMSDWHAGYTAETSYTYGYYTELNPLRSQLLMLHAGIMPPKVGTACELGFGQGISVNIHAAAATTRWYGNDFNPAQAAFAQELADAAGSGAVLSDESFQDFCGRSDLPDFDYIGLHGIWSWISPENQRTIVSFLGRKLKPGGVLYISYNTDAGWAAMAPIRALLHQHGRVMSLPGQDVRTRVASALSFVQRMMDTTPRYLLANPASAARLQQLGELDPNYLAHEYFNSHWQAAPFSAIAPVLGEAKLEFAASAAYPDHVDPLNLTPEHLAFLAHIPDATLREVTRDFLVNRQFRHDYWVKGARRLHAVEQAAALRAVRMLLVLPRAAVTMTVAGSLGEAAMDEDVYAPVLDVLADHRIHTLAELEQGVQGKAVTLSDLLQIVLVLAHKNCISLVQDDATIALARPTTDRLNRHLLHQALGRTDLAALASPVTGGGVGVLHLQQLFLLARSQGLRTLEEWAMFVWQAFQPLQQGMVRNGVALATREENLAEIVQHAEHFRSTGLPILQALGIAD